MAVYLHYILRHTESLLHFGLGRHSGLLQPKVGGPFYVANVPSAALLASIVQRQDPQMYSNLLEGPNEYRKIYRIYGFNG